MEITLGEDIPKWISDQQYAAETSEFGVNKKGVFEAFSDAERQLNAVARAKSTVDNAAINLSNVDDREELLRDFSVLEATVKKRQECLSSLSEVVEIEDTFEPLWKLFVQKSTDLVQGLRKNSSSTSSPEDWTTNTSQNCIEATKNVWGGVATAMKCAALHLKHAASYHEFFFDIDELRRWMTKDLTKAEDLLQPRKSTDANDTEDIKKLTFEIKTALALYLHWRQRTMVQWTRSETLIPVPLRLKDPECELPVVSLVNYRTNEFTVFEGEQLTLVDNGLEQLWKVRNLRGDVGFVPSTFILIPGPDAEAVNAAIELRLQFLLHWTKMIKRLGTTIIRFLLTVIRDWTTDEEKMIRSLSSDEKLKIHRLLNTIENLFSPHWDPYPSYAELRIRITRLRTLLDESVTSENGNAEETATSGNLLVIDTESLLDLLFRFKDFWSNWEQVKVTIEMSRHPEYLLTVESADRVNFRSFAEAQGLWTKFLLDFDESESGESLVTRTGKSGGSGFGEAGSRTGESGASQSEVVSKENAQNLGHESQTTVNGIRKGGIGTETEAVDGMETIEEWDESNNARRVSEVCTIETAAERAEASQLTTSEQEERQTFIITSVTDPRNGEQISLDVAVSSGIINQAEGKYVNPQTGEAIPIAAAMSAGKIQVEMTKVNKSKEKKSDLGLITIRTYREARPFSVHSVIDAKTEKEMAVDVAIKAGILDLKRGVYKNLNTEEELSLADALDSGLLNVEYDEKEDAKTIKSEVVSKTYAVHAVVDTMTSTRLSFSEALSSGLINTEKGTYLNRSTDTSIFIGDAIRRGLVKASVVNDPALLQVSTQNVITLLDTTKQSVRRKLIRPLMAIYALRKAGEEAGGV